MYNNTYNKLSKSSLYPRCVPSWEDLLAKFKEPINTSCNDSEFSLNYYDKPKSINWIKPGLKIS